MTRPTDSEILGVGPEICVLMSLPRDFKVQMLWSNDAKLNHTGGCVHWENSWVRSTRFWVQNCELHGFERKVGHTVRTGSPASPGPQKTSWKLVKCKEEQSSPQAIECGQNWNTNEKIGTSEAVEPG